MQIHWPLVISTACQRVGLGMFACAFLANLALGTVLPLNVVALATLTLLAVGGIASIFHLQTPARFFNAFSNFGSHLTQEALITPFLGIALLACGLNGFVYDMGPATIVVETAACILAAEFVDEVAQCCFEVDYVSSKGGYVPLDPRSMKKAYADRATFALYRSEDFQTRALARSLSPDETNPHDYAALYYTGGHGVMWDFPGSEGLARLGLSIYDQGGYLASVCHGIAGLLYLRVNGEYVVAGKNITGSPLRKSV